MRIKNVLSSLIWMSIIYIVVFLDSSTNNVGERCDGYFCQQEQHQSLSSAGSYKPGASDVTKILFLGYRRGGSSISSEIFDTDPRAIFWYEPLDAFYFSYTGYYGRKDQRVLMYDNETDFRPAEPWEHSKMVEFFQELYNCDLSRMPSEFLSHRFLKHTSVIADYDICYHRNSPDSLTQDLDKCRDILEHICGRSVETSLQNKCLEIMHTVHTTYVRQASALKGHSPMMDEIRKELYYLGLDGAYVEDIIREVSQYSKCLSKIELTIQKCLPKAISACTEKKLRAVKIVRAAMSIVKSIISAIPELRIIIFIRDPRAMAYSRSGKDKLSMNIINSGIRACKKLSVDLFYIKQLNKMFPGAIKIMKYEDFVSDPHYWATVMYRHVGYSSPSQVDDFIQSHMFAGEDDGKKWGNIRTNATDIANRWRSLMPPDAMSEIQKICSNLLVELDYPLY